MIHHYFPGMIEQKVQGHLLRYAGREEQLLQELISKHGPEPPPAGAPEPARGQGKKAKGEAQLFPQSENTKSVNVSLCSHRITFEPPQLQVPQGFEEWKSWKLLITRDADGKPFKADYCFDHSAWDYQIRPQLWQLLYRCNAELQRSIHEPRKSFSTAASATKRYMIRRR